MTSPEPSVESAPQTVEPAINNMIGSILLRYEESLGNGELYSYRHAQDEGEQIDIACLKLGPYDRDASIKLKALRYVRKFSRQIYGDPIEERDFDFPLLSFGGDHQYWRTVDDYFMQLIELQARNNQGEFFPPLSWDTENGKSKYFRIASLLGTDVLKATAFCEGDPTHVWYRAQRVQEATA